MVLKTELDHRDWFISDQTFAVDADDGRRILALHENGLTKSFNLVSCLDQRVFLGFLLHAVEGALYDLVYNLARSLLLRVLLDQLWLSRWEKLDTEVHKVLADIVEVEDV